MIKRITAFLIACLICAAAVVSVFAYDSSYVAFSEGFFIDEDKLEALDGMAKNIKRTYGFPVYYTLTDSIDPCPDLYEYAESEFNSGAEGMAGVYFVSYIKDNSENTYLYVSDELATLFTEDTRQKIFDAYDGAASYYDSAVGFYNCVSAVLEENSGAAAEIAEKAMAAAEAAKEEEKQPQLIKDRTGLISIARREKLNKKLAGYSEECKCDFAVLVVDSLGGLSSSEYAEKYYESSGCGYGETKDGVLLLLSITGVEGENDWNVYRSAKVKEWYSDKTVSKLMKPVVKKLKAGDYTGAVERYADGFKGQFGKHASPSLIWLPLSFVIGFAIAFIVMKIKTANLQSVYSQTDANSYIKEESFVINSSNDIFIDKEVSKSAIASASSSASERSDTVSGGGASTGGKF